MLSSYMYLYGLGDMPLTDPDEPFYAQTAKEMVEANEWVTPTLFGKPQFEKPILYYWLIEISYKIFGVSEFSARFPSAVMGGLGLLGVYLLGSVLFSPVAGILSALVMSISVMHLALSRACVTDMTLSVFILYCLFFFIRAFRGSKTSDYILCGICAALAVLTKGPIGLFIPGMVMALYVIPLDRWRRLRLVPIFFGIAGFLAVCLPWYIMATHVHGESFISEFFGFQNITRFTTPEHKSGISPLYYFPVVLFGILPWTSFFISALWFSHKRDRSFFVFEGGKLFLTSWFLVVFIFFSISSTKLVTYIFPLFAPMGLILGRFWEKIIEGDRDYTSSPAMKWAYGILVLAGAIGIPVGFFVLKEEYPSMAVPVVGYGIMLLCFMIYSFFKAVRGDMRAGFFALVGGVVVLFIPIMNMVSPIVGEYESTKSLGTLAKEYAKENELIAGENDGRRGVAFYTDRVNVPDVHTYDDLENYLADNGRVWAIVRKKHAKEFEKIRKGKTYEIVASSGKYLLVTNQPFEAQE